MLKKSLFLFALTAGVMLTLPATARTIAQPSGQKCEMVENVTLGLNFNNVPVKIAEAREYITSKSEEIESIATELGIEDLEIQNMNYNIYANNHGGCHMQVDGMEYRMNGGMSFKMQDAEKASVLMERLGEKGYMVNFNMNAYRQCQ